MFIERINVSVTGHLSRYLVTYPVLVEIDHIYIYIYMCVCVCVCVYIYYTRTHRHTHTTIAIPIIYSTRPWHLRHQQRIRHTLN